MVPGCVSTGGLHIGGNLHVDVSEKSILPGCEEGGERQFWDPVAEGLERFIKIPEGHADGGDYEDGAAVILVSITISVLGQADDSKGYRGPPLSSLRVVAWGAP